MKAVYCWWLKALLHCMEVKTDRNDKTNTGQNKNNQPVLHLTWFIVWAIYVIIINPNPII